MIKGLCFIALMNECLHFAQKKINNQMKVFKRSVLPTGAVDRDDRAKLPGHPGLVSEPEMQGA